MNQLAVIDLTTKRSAAALKAWETRRSRQLEEHRHQAAEIEPPRQSGANEALAAFEREASADNPDWHRASLLLRRALVEKQAPKPKALRQADAPAWHDYPIGSVNPLSLHNPTVLVTFADGERVRAPAVSRRGRPVNIGRGLRVAIAFYQARIAWRSGLSNEAGNWRAVPPVVRCTCEDTGESYDVELCNTKTAEHRAAKDWNLWHVGQAALG